MLNDNIHKQIERLCAEGDMLADRQCWDPALAKYHDALELVPEPKNNWEAATWIFTAIGETLFFKGDYEEAIRHLASAIECPDGLGNPLIHLRLGQSLYERGELDLAADELVRAYMGAGIEIFEAEDEKFIRFLSTKIRLQ